MCSKKRRRDSVHTGTPAGASYRFVPQGWPRHSKPGINNSSSANLLKETAHRHQAGGCNVIARNVPRSNLGRLTGYPESVLGSLEMLEFVFQNFQHDRKIDNISTKYASRDSSVDTATWLQTKQSRNYGSIPRGSKDLSGPKPSRQTLGPS
jgi:hypothetical protein